MNHGILGRARWGKSWLFWLGLPGLVFLVWAWVQSNSSQTILKPLRPMRLEASSGSGRLQVIKLTTEPGYIYSINRRSGLVRAEEAAGVEVYVATASVPLIRQLPVRVSEREWFPSARFHRGVLGPASGFATVVMPYWSLISGYLVAWAGVVIWRGRVRRFWKGRGA